MIIRMIATILLVLVCCGAIFGQVSTTEKPLKVRAIYPAGEEVATSDRITIEFNQNVVSLGASMFIDDVVPVEIEPAVECEWNWVKLNTLQCELPIDSDLESATKYTVTVRLGIRAPNGQEMVESHVHSFETIVPSITYAGLVSWRSSTQPIVDISFNQSVNLESLQDRLFLYDTSADKEIPVKICPSNWRLSSTFGDDYFGRERTYQRFDQSDCDIAGVNGSEVLVLPVEQLSPKSKVSVLLLPGLEGARGNLTATNRVVVDTEITTFDEFRLLGLVCQDVLGNDQFLKVDELNEKTCKVHSKFSLVFSSRIEERSSNKYVLIEQQGTSPIERSFSRWYGPQKFDGFNHSIRGDFRSNSIYRVYVASIEQTNDGTEQSIPIQDGFGRSLVGPNEITFSTNRPLPRAKINKTKVIVHSNGTVDPQIAMGNVNDVTIIYDTLDEKGVQLNQIQQRQSPDRDDVLQTEFLGLRSTLRSPSGVMSGAIVSQPRFDHPNDKLENLFFAQATPYSVFVKLGTVKTLAWVVDFQTGEPVADADVEFYLGDSKNLATIRESIFIGKTNSDGLVSLPGYETFDPHWDRTVYDFDEKCDDTSDCPVYFLRAEGEAGLALLPLDDAFKIRGYIWPYHIYEDFDHWATTSQDLYLPGDTVHIKGFVRTRRNEKRMIPDEGHFALCVRSSRGREFEVTPITLNQFGSYRTSLKLNGRTNVGEYDIHMVFNAEKPVLEPCANMYWGTNTYEAIGGSFTVFHFKTNPIRVTQTLDAMEYDRGDSLTITTQAELHAGGPYAHVDGIVAVSLRPDDPPVENVLYKNYVISRHPSYRSTSSLYHFDIELDHEGKSITSVDKLDSFVYYGILEVESAVISDRGKAVATRSSVPYYGVNQFVGIHRPDSYYSPRTNLGEITVGQPWPIQVLVFSKDDELAIGTEVQITVYASRTTKAESEPFSRFVPKIEWEQIFDCTVESAEDPVSCEFLPPEKNYYRIDARIVDAKGNSHQSSILVQAVAENVSQREIANAETVKLELMCGSKNATVGDTIRCEVQNYLSSSPLLVTIERTSVIDEWLVRLDPENPVIEFTVLDEYEPHFKLSVLNLALLGTKNSPSDPLYRIASKGFTMDNPRLVPLSISVSSNRKFYQPRDRVKLSISAARNQGGATPIEYAIAVVDEALLDLSTRKETYFDPTKKTWVLSGRVVSMYGLVKALLEESELRFSTPMPYWDQTIPPRNTSASSSVITTGTYMPISKPYTPFGIENESDPSVRNIDRFVAYWNPSVVSNNGRLSLDFVLPDNLTRWKVLVIAVSTDDRFGYAHTTFASLKDTEVRAVVPNVVTEGDSFQIGASILNRADRKRKLRVELKASGGLTESSNTTYQKLLNFNPFERKVVTWDVEAGRLPQTFNLQQPIKASQIRVIASAGDRKDKDALDITIPVRSNRVRVSSVAYGALDADNTTIPIAIPNKVAGDIGQLDFTLTTNKAVNFDGVFRYAIEYPYSCWEQELTKAILAMQYVQIEKRGAENDVQWSDPEELIAKVLKSAGDYQVPNGGMAYFIPRYRFDDPYLSAYTAIAFSWLETAGYDVPQDVKRKLIDYLRKFLGNEDDVLKDVGYFWSDTLFNQLQATVGAVVLHALAALGELKETEVSLYSEQINQMDLFGLSHYLMASLKLDPTHQLNEKIFNRIMNHRSLVDGAIEFVESVPRKFTRILHSDTRSLCSVLEALTQLSENSTMELELGELNQLSNAVRYARENMPYWSNTQDNVFCTKALITFFDYIDSDSEELLATVDLRSDETGDSIRLADGWRFNSSTTQLRAHHTLQSQLFGSHGAIEISRLGDGSAFYDIELSYLTTVDERINRFSGFEIHREYVAYRDRRWHILKPGDQIDKGEYVLVNLYLKNRFDRHHVVVDDTVPGGLEPVNIRLETEFIPHFDEYELAEILSTSELYREFKGANHWGFRYRELGLENVRYFGNSIRRGKYHLTWLGQAISAGEFTVLPTHVEEMYRPIMFGKAKSWTLTVKDRSQSSVE